MRKHKSDKKMNSLSDLVSLNNDQNTTYIEKGKIEIHKLMSSRNSDKSIDHVSSNSYENKPKIFNGTISQIKV